MARTTQGPFLPASDSVRRWGRDPRRYGQSRPARINQPRVESCVSWLLALVCLSIPACGVFVQNGGPLDWLSGPALPRPHLDFRETSLPPLKAELPIIEGAKYVDDDEECFSCHEEYEKTHKSNVHHNLRGKNSCEACHGPCSKHVDSSGEKPGSVLSFKSMDAAQRSEACGRCHEGDACSSGSMVTNWRTSVHAHAGVSCTECHRAHYDVPARKQADSTSDSESGSAESRVALASHQQPSKTSPSANVPSNSLGAATPDLCYRCHGDMLDLQRIAGPHQIGGPNGFQCATCHDPHGNIVQESRQDLCLPCHQRGSPTMAWHSSTHAIAGVACTDCHNPHPRANAAQATEISHTSVTRPPRMAMSVQQPQACYQCHPKIMALSELPSHHPIQEGKMVCSDCHDAHGQAAKGLREPTVNMVCYRCHAEKEGPFVYEHPPVTEDCGICHEPHGTVTNDLLRQTTTFLCLRCHAGHRSDTRSIDATGNSSMRQALYGDCTQCHSQVHGSDVINEVLQGRGLTR